MTIITPALFAEATTHSGDPAGVLIRLWWVSSLVLNLCFSCGEEPVPVIPVWGAHQRRNSSAARASLVLKWITAHYPQLFS